ncbi:MAG: nucleotide-binding domain containing protein, partial [Burkholderiales bacterium]
PRLLIEGAIVFVVGSRAVQSREQVDRLKTLVGTEVLQAPNGVVVEPQELGGALQIVIVSAPDASGAEGDPAVVSAALAHGALDMVRRTRSQALVATGGDTAIAVLDASGCAALEVIGDLMPGLPYARVQLDGRALWFVTKAGGFGGRDTLYEIALRLRGGSKPAEANA